MFKAQISAEYLVILAAVLVIAVIAIYVLASFVPFGASNLETQSKSYWTGASPFSIDVYKISGTTIQFQLINNDLDQLTLTGISLANSSVYSGSTVFNSGQSILVTGTLPSSCGQIGAPYSYSDLIFTYSKASISGLQQTGQVALIGHCS